MFKNISINNAEVISSRYGEVTRSLNMEFRETESRTSNNLQVGSYGRWTAIRGISDLDMLYIMPSTSWSDYKDGGQYKLLSNTAQAIRKRYPNTKVKVDTLVVVVQYDSFKIEVQPVFEDKDGNYIYPYTRGGSSWRTTKPRPELEAADTRNKETNGNFRRLAKITRSWKNRHGVVMGGLLIDTLVYNFLGSTSDYDKTSYASCGKMLRDFLKYLADQPVQDRYGALGSRQHVKVHKKFQSKAKKGYELAQKAVDAGDDPRSNKHWRKLLGTAFPKAATEAARSGFIFEGNYKARDTEQYIENNYPIDIRYNLEIDCEITQPGFRSRMLRLVGLTNMGRGIFLNKSLRFHITKHNLPDDCIFYWKVLNRGKEAIRHDMIRGQITRGRKTQTETSNFSGEHVVECYAVLDGVVVARDRISVPIGEVSES